MLIPNSGMTISTGEDHQIIRSGRKIVDGYAKSDESKRFDLRLNTDLRWVKSHEPSHKTPGSRSPMDYDGKYRLKKIPKLPIILFDDVYTSGSQMKAAIKFLTDKSIDVRAIITLAKTKNEPSTDPLRWREEACTLQTTMFGGIF